MSNIFYGSCQLNCYNSFFLIEKESEKIEWIFCPIMVVWFASIAFSVIAFMFYTPGVLKAFVISIRIERSLI